MSKTALVKKDKKEPIHYEFAEWFYKQPVSRVVPHKEIREKIAEIRRNNDLPSRKIESTDIVHWIAHSRRYLVKNYQLCIVNVPMEGYKIANPQEYVFFTFSRFRNAILGLSWCKDLAPGVDRRLVGQAVDKYFTRTGVRMQALLREGLQLIATWGPKIKEQKKQLEQK